MQVAAGFEHVIRGMPYACANLRIIRLVIAM
jgi:hypothetical protein